MWSLEDWGVLDSAELGDHGHPGLWGTGASWAVRIMDIRDTGDLGASGTLGIMGVRDSAELGYPRYWGSGAIMGIQGSGHLGLWVWVRADGVYARSSDGAGDGLVCPVSVLALVMVLEGWVSSDGREHAVSACSR